MSTRRPGYIENKEGLQKRLHRIEEQVRSIDRTEEMMGAVRRLLRHG